MKKELLMGTALVSTLGAASVAEAVSATYSGNHQTGIEFDSPTGGTDTNAQINDNNFTVSLSETTDGGMTISSSFKLMDENTKEDYDAGLTLAFTDGSKLDVIAAGNASGSHAVSIPGSAGAEDVANTSTNMAPTGLDFMTGSTALGVEYHTAEDFLADGLKMSFSASTDSGAAAAATYRIDSHVAIGATYVTDLGDTDLTIGAGYSAVDGAFCEYYLVNDYVFFPVDESVDVINATLLLDVMGTGGHAIKRAQLIHKDIQSVLINGAGPIGLGLLAMSKLTFAKDLPVLINDVKSSRLPLAEKMGGLPIDLSKQSLEEGMEQHGIKNPDVAIDATGKAVARKNALQALAKRGVLVMVGNGEGLEFEQYPDMGGPERSILGSEYFSYNEMEANHELLKNNQQYLSQIITHQYNIEDVQKSYEHFFSPESDAGKIAVVHN